MSAFAQTSTAPGSTGQPTTAQPTLGTDDGAHRTLALAALAEFEAARYAEALALFEEAARVRDTARIRRGIAKTLFELGRYVETMDQCEVALAQEHEALPSELRADVEALRARAQRFVARVHVRFEPSGAGVELSLDGVPIAVASLAGESRVERRVDLGRHVWRARRAHYRDAGRAIEVRGGERLEVVLTLVPEVPATTQVRREVTVVDRPSHIVPALAVTFGIAGAAALVGGLVWWSDRAGAIDTCNAGAARGSYCRGSDAIESQRDASIVATIGGGVLLAGSAVLALLALTAPDRSARSGRAAIAACQPIVGGAYCAGSASW